MLRPYIRTSHETYIQRLFRGLFEVLHRILRGCANNLLSKTLIRPREFSNAILKYYGPLFTGSVINVSGWKDGDFEGGTNATYFPKATSYSVSNAPTKKKGVGSLPNEIHIDLSKPIPDNQKNMFDVVFNHTTIEHIFELETAMENLCNLSRDVVIIVAPTLQHIHFNKGYGDYTRLTPMGIVRTFEKNDFEVLVLDSNEQQFSPIFAFAIAVRKNSPYTKLIEKHIDLSMGGLMFGSGLTSTHALDMHEHLSSL